MGEVDMVGSVPEAGQMKFYMYIQDKVVGPYGPEDVRKQFGGVAWDTQICRADKYDGGSRKWHAIGNIPELSNCIKREISEPLANAPAPSGSPALSILSTDDDPNIRELLWHILEDAGHRVEFARDGEEVFKRLAEKKYDLVILDVNMPKMNGYKVSELIHKKLSAPPKVIIFTGRDLQKERLQFVCSDADAILSKGVDNDKLVRTIEGLFAGGRERGRTASEARPPAAVPVFRSLLKPAEVKPGKGPAGEVPLDKPEAPAPAGPFAYNPVPPVPKEPRPGDTGRAMPASLSGTARRPGPAPEAGSRPSGEPRQALASAPVPGSGEAGTGVVAEESKAPPFDMNLLMGHIDLECARLEMQFEKHALKLLETNRESARKLQAEWRRTRRFMTFYALALLAAVSLAGMLF